MPHENHWTKRYLGYERITKWQAKRSAPCSAIPPPRNKSHKSTSRTQDPSWPWYTRRILGLDTILIEPEHSETNKRRVRAIQNTTPPHLHWHYNRRRYRWNMTMTWLGGVDLALRKMSIDCWHGSFHLVNEVMWMYWRCSSRSNYLEEFRIQQGTCIMDMDNITTNATRTGNGTSSGFHGSIDYDLYRTICSLQPSRFKVYFQIIIKREKVYDIYHDYILSSFIHWTFCIGLCYLTSNLFRRGPVTSSSLKSLLHFRVEKLIELGTHML